jgi:hypothetical protein
MAEDDDEAAQVALTPQVAEDKKDGEDLKRSPQCRSWVSPTRRSWQNSRELEGGTGTGPTGTVPTPLVLPALRIP